MSGGANATLRLAAASAGPLLILVSLVISLNGDTASAALGGLIATLAFFLNVIVFGVDGAKRAAPPIALRAVTALGALLVLTFVGADYVGADAPRAVLNWGVWCVVAGSSSLALAAIAARTHALSDETW